MLLRLCLKQFQTHEMSPNTSGSCYFPTVTSDWHGADKNADGMLTREAKVAIDQRSEQLVGLSTRERSKRTLMKPHLANMEKLKAFDQSLKLGTLINGCEHFTSPYRVGKLLINEKRYRLNAEGLDPDIAMGLPFRSCILDTSTGDRRLEVS
jgi:hypothetical protein